MHFVLISCFRPSSSTRRAGAGFHSAPASRGEVGATTDEVGGGVTRLNVL